MAKGDSQQSATSTQTSTPWDAQQPYLKQGFNAAKSIYNTAGPSYYPNSTVAPSTANQNSAYSQAASFGGDNSGLNTAINQNNQIASGNFGGAGDAVFKNIQDRVMPTVAGQFEGSGRYGPNAAFGAASTNALTDAYAPYASSMMNSALDRSSTLANSQWSGINNQATLGAQQQQQGQNETNDAVARYNYNSQLPQLKLNQYMQNIGGNWGNTTTATQPYNQPSIWSQLLGGLTAGAGLLG